MTLRSYCLSNLETVKIPIWWLGQHGYLKEGKTGVITWDNWLTGDEFILAIRSDVENGESPYIRIVYDAWLEEDKKRIDYNITLTKTKCFYGNFRYWFLCPVPACRKRVGVLYKPKGGTYFCCRHCHRMTYASKNLSKKFRGPHLLHDFDLDNKISKLSDSIVKTHYRDKPTRKQKKLNDLYEKLFNA